MSYVAAVGNPSAGLRQCAPSSYDSQNEFSKPRYTRCGLRVSGRIARADCAGKPSAMRVQRAPQSCVTNTYGA